MTPQKIIVVGAGILGASTALWLQRDGHQVTLVDRTGPAAGTSYGNAGILATGAIVPVAVPGLWRKAPRMLLDRNQPLFMRWRYLPRLANFLPRFLAQARRVDEIAGHLHTLLHDAVQQHATLNADIPAAAALMSPDDWVYLYADEAAYRADSYGWDMRRKHGVPFATMSHADLRAYDPALADRFGFAVRMTNHGRITDPGAYVQALVDQLTAKGGQFVQATVQDLQLDNGTCRGLITDQGPLHADQYVLTMGAWTAPLAKRLGITVPLDTERGYHLEFTNPSLRFDDVLMVAAGKFGVNSMNGRLRCAGVVEFGGVDAPPSRAPFDFLRRQVASYFPDLTYDDLHEWMGHRPSTADSLPVIGHAPKAANVLLGYGHQHVGLTGGPKTGRWLAQLARGETPNTDLSAFAPDRTVRF